MFQFQLERCLLLDGFKPPPWEREYTFARPRRWRFDFAWPTLKLAVEIEGVTGIFGNQALGRHQRAAGMEKDCEKYNEAACLGWRVIRVTQAQVRKGLALQWVERMFTLLTAET